jgi:hypothetical protein
MLHVVDYTIIAEWFPRLLGIIYFFAFGSIALQIQGLIGERGILPVGAFLNHIRATYPKNWYLVVPTVFWFNSSNLALRAVSVGGALLSLCLLAGLFPPLMLLLLFILYLSIVSAGQEFLSFGWEGFLLEITANAFLISLTTVPNVMAWISLNFLLFRFHIQAGAVKLQSRDPNWVNQSAIAYHYLSQPLPNAVAWFMHKLPLRFHQISCGIMFFCELVVPFGIFFGETIRLITFVGLFGLQFFIWATGNLSFLNHLTVIFCTILLNNSALEAIGMTAPIAQSAPQWLDISITVVASALLALQVVRFIHHFLPNQIFAKILRPFDSFHLVNRYGLFAVMTTKRYEIIIEGSDDGKEWKEYTFIYKPSELNHKPGRVSPYQPRLDWQAWFLPFSKFGSERWFTSFMGHLLQGTPDVVALLKSNPFSNKPPVYVRAQVYDYVFSTKEERAKTGNWWNRTFVGSYSPPITLKH